MSILYTLFPKQIKHEATRDMLFSQRKYTIINQRTQICNEISFLFEKNKKTLTSKKSLIRYPTFDTPESSVTLLS